MQNESFVARSGGTLKQLIIWVLVLVLAIPALGRESTPKQQAHKIRAGTEIEVTLRNGEFLRGRMGTMSSTGFVLMPMKNDQGISRTVVFAEVTVIQTPKHVLRKSGKTVLITFIATGAFFVVLMIYLSASGQLH